MTAKEPHDLQCLERLLAWFAAEQRDLPWRRERDVYGVLLSELMLQQTQCKTVIPYYLKFRAAWPTLADLAAADEAEVLKAWEGLGYYSRARRLLTLAREICDTRGGELPQTAAELERLPGLGPYTAAMVAALAFGENVAAVDGNLIRVFARLWAEPFAQTGAADRKRLAGLLAGRLPAGRAGAVNEALMDLGAEICTSKQPRCTLCPLRADCRAYALGRVADFPVLQPRAARPVELRHYARLREGQNLYLRLRTERLLQGMAEYLLPDSLEPALLAEVQRYRLETKAPVLLSGKHDFTHKRWVYTVEDWPLRAPLPAALCERLGLTRYTPEEQQKLAFPAFLKKLEEGAAGASGGAHA